MKKSSFKSITNPKQFWTFQLVGWGIFCVPAFMIGFLFTDNYKSLSIIVTSNTIGGFSFTLLLRQIYKRIWNSKQKSIKATSYYIIFFSILFGLIWNYLTLSYVIKFQLLSNVVMRNVSFTIEEFIMYLGIPFRTMIFMTWSAIYFGIHYFEDYQNEHERRLIAKAEEHKAQISMLKSQLNPHFLFNILNSLNALISENKESAKKLIADLSDFLRNVTQNPMKEQISISEEIQMVNTYLNLQKVRFEDKFMANIEVDSEIESILIPSFILNPIVENAIKYGLETSDYPVMINIRGQKLNDGIKLVVSNSGEWVDDSKIQKGKISVGLDNVKKQLESLYPNKHKFNHYEKDGFVIVEMEIST